jgi:hypothetical protein
MSAVTAGGLLAAWEQAYAVPAVGRPAALLSAFGKPGQPSIGTRDAALLAVYAEHFGPILEGLARCPGCGTDVELGVPIAELTASVPAARAVEPLVVGDHTVTWRLPDDADLAAAGACEPDEGALLLLSRCVTGTLEEIPDDVRELLAERIAAADPYADLSLDLVCPECEAHWRSALDIGEFVWAETRSRAHRLLREVDELARAYGWPEDRILALSQQRRDAYLELVRDG